MPRRKAERQWAGGLPGKSHALATQHQLGTYEATARRFLPHFRLYLMADSVCGRPAATREFLSHLACITSHRTFPFVSDSVAWLKLFLGKGKRWWVGRIDGQQPRCVTSVVSVPYSTEG